MPKAPLTEEALRLDYGYHAVPKKKLKAVLKEDCSCSSKTLLNLFPIADWLPHYKWRKNLVGDIIAGVTVAVMHIPHGLAYSQLSYVPPVVGLYMAIFPLIPYVIMGTSRHISLGTFAVMCAMTGDIVTTHSNAHFDVLKNTSTYTNLEIATAAAMSVSFWQIAMSLLRLGYLTVFMSHSLISGFTTGAAVHVMSYQFKNLLGIKTERFSGPLKLIYIYIDIFEKIKETNFVTMGISIAFVVFLLVYNFGFKVLAQKRLGRFHVLIPIEMIVIMLGISLSYFLEFEKNYGVHVVGALPKGMPVPFLPPIKLLPELILPSFPLALVAMAINVSLAQIFARKQNYTVSSRQEILAYGFSNLAGSFFSCLPVAASLSRSMVQYTSGGKTQIATAVSIIHMILILLLIGSVFEPVPYCVLSAIVVASLVGILLQVRDLFKMWRLSYLDALVWLITFLVVVLVDIVYGLLMGFIASLLVIIIRNQRPQIRILGQVSDENRFLDLDYFDSSLEVPNVIIVQVIGNIHFANSQYIQGKILKFLKRTTVNRKERYSPTVIVDLSGAAFIDPTGVTALLALNEDVLHKKFRLFLANCNVFAFNDLESRHFFSTFPKELVFATLSDAVAASAQMKGDVSEESQEEVSRV